MIFVLFSLVLDQNMSEFCFPNFPFEIVKLYLDRVHDISWELDRFEVCQLLSFLHSILTPDDEIETSIMTVS